MTYDAVSCGITEIACITYGGRETTDRVCGERTVGRTDGGKIAVRGVCTGRAWRTQGGVGKERAVGTVAGETVVASVTGGFCSAA